MNASQEKAWTTLADDLVIRVPARELSTSVHPDAHVDWAATFGREAPLFVEIGSGRGEALVALAEQHPEANVVAFNPPPIRGLGTAGGFELYVQARTDTDPVRLQQVVQELIGALSADPVWLAVALFHFGMIPANAVAGEAWYAAVTDDACVAYLPRVDGESVRMLLEVMDKSDAPATVYTHQVSALRQRLGRPEAEILPVPEMIVKRFGLEVTP